MLTIKVSFHIYLLFMFELMTASGAKSLIILRKVSLFYTNLVRFRLISDVITTSNFSKRNQNYGRRLWTGFETKTGYD